MHLLVDLDGTLTDPARGITRCIRHALETLEIEIDPAYRLERFIGPPLRDTFRQLCGPGCRDDDIERAVARYRERFATIGLFENAVYDGIPACLAQLRERADSIHLATSKPAIYARRIVDHFDLARYLDGIYGSELDGRYGDKSELLEHLLQCEGLDPSVTTMIGDRRYDVVGARANRLRAIGVLWGYGSREELQQAGADLLCQRPADLPGLL